MASQSFFDKLNTLISANMHGMVDRALEANSVKVMDEYIRQVERNLEELEESTASVGGTVRTLKRKYEELIAQTEKLDRDIDTLIIKGKNDLAGAAQTELNGKQKSAQEYYGQWQTQEQQYQTMLNMRLKLEAKLTTVKQERQQVQALMELAAAKKQTLKTVKSLDDIVKLGDQDVNRIASSIRDRIDQEDARLELATKSISDQVNEAVSSSEIDMQLEERRRRLLGNS
ncbi:MAG: PspA/IM30 family protein [Phototrophicaceae bacterium]